MRRSALSLLPLAALLVAAVALDAARAAPAGDMADLPPARELALDIERGQATGVALAADGALALTGLPAAWSEAPYAVAGSLVGPAQPLAEPALTLTARWAGEAPPGTAVRLEVRGWDGERAAPWAEAPVGGGSVTLPWPATAVQYRLTLLARDGAAGPGVRAIWLEPADAPMLAMAAATPPAPAAPLRVYGTRIGLIGRTTANGTVIAPEDRFVALPSRRVLATKGGREYQVRLDYKGKSVVVPVWDIGPWNVRDNYWEASARRDMWNDLPPGRPQSAAAYFDVYNGGRDGYGRRITSPAGVDISDAAFADLGMTQGDWVMVTFLWQTKQ